MITILTEPSFQWRYRLSRFLRLFIKKYFLKRPALAYSGHFAVTRSLIEGLRKIGEPFVYNPRRQSEVTWHVHVLCGVHTLQYAIKLKREGRIKRLTAGPNIVVSSADYNGLVAAPEIDFYFVNSEWTKLAYLIDNPKLQGRIDYFPSGIDADYWRIAKTGSGQLRFAFYNKRPEPILYEECIKISKCNGVNVVEVKYGSYSLNELKSVLSSVDFVIYFVEQESQGIALAEIWATDTPTIVWNPGFWNYKMKNYQSSSAPYLTEDTGLFFRTAEEFKELFVEEKLKRENFQPRQWVLENMTDEICAKNFLKLTKANEAGRQGNL
jgi:glycosyltransferase involved in cell wall biosynthesis